LKYAAAALPLIGKAARRYIEPFDREILLEMAFPEFIPSRWWHRRHVGHMPEILFGYVTSSLLEQSFPEACRRLGVRPLHGPRRHWRYAHSCGAPVELPNGSRVWPKATGLPISANRDAREREEAADGITAVPKPAILDIADWNVEGVSWRGLLLSRAPLPTIKLNRWLFGPSPRLSDAWLSELRSALEALARVETDKWRISPKQVASKIAAHFGPNAPHEADEWRTCHGDLVFANLTAPTLSILHWECWGLAPRGFDAARLLTHAVTHPRLANRIKCALTDDLTTPSGRVATLLACAEALDKAAMNRTSSRRGEAVKAFAERALHSEP
jgi:hypothetical protein